MTMNFVLNNDIDINVVDKADNNTNMYWRDYRAIVNAYNNSTCDDICTFVVANNEDKVKHIDKIGTKVALNATNALIVSVITVDELYIFIKTPNENINGFNLWRNHVGFDRVTLCRYMNKFNTDLRKLNQKELINFIKACNFSSMLNAYSR